MLEKKEFLSKNNFDLMRLLLALTVCLVHSYDLSGFEELHLVTSVFSSSVAVKSFFVISGFLIFSSFEKSKSIASFAKKRILRIYPAYFFVIISSSFLLYFVSPFDFYAYFNLDWFKYLFYNILFMGFMKPNLPGVFDTNKFVAVNGALWTLKVEIMFYFTVPLLVSLFSKFSKHVVILVVYFMSVIYALALAKASFIYQSSLYDELSRQLPGQMSYFISGAAFFYYMNFFERWKNLALILALSVFAFNYLYPLPFLYPFALATVVIYFVMFSHIVDCGKYGDFSYGVYIIHYPLIQILLSTGLFSGKPLLFLCTTILSTLFLSYFMWHMVEKRFLSRDNHYVSDSV